MRFRRAAPRNPRTQKFQFAQIVPKACRLKVVGLGVGACDLKNLGVWPVQRPFGLQFHNRECRLGDREDQWQVVAESCMTTDQLSAAADCRFVLGIIAF